MTRGCRRGAWRCPDRRRSSDRVTGSLDQREFRAGCAALLASQSSRPKREIRKAVGVGMVATEMPLEDKLKMLREVGFDGVEVTRPDSLPLDALLKARD